MNSLAVMIFPSFVSVDDSQTFNPRQITVISILSEGIFLKIVRMHSLGESPFILIRNFSCQWEVI